MKRLLHLLALSAAVGLYALNLQAHAQLPGPQHETGQLTYRVREDKINFLVEATRYEEAQQEADSYLEAVARTDGKASAAFATALSYRGFVLLSRSRFREAKADFENAVELYRSSNGQERYRANALNNLGQVNQAEGRNAEAEKLYGEALAIQERTLSPSDIDIATSLANIAHMHQLRGEVLVAEGLLRRALEIRRIGYPENHSIIATTLQNLATALEPQRKLREAETLLREALSMRIATHHKLHPHLAGAMHKLGVNLYRQQRHAEGEKLLLDALLIRRASNAFLLDRAINLRDLAQIYILQKRFAEAQKVLSEARAIYEMVVPSTHLHLAEVFRDLAYVADGLNQHQKALELSRGASAIYIERRARDSSARIQYQNHVELAWTASRNASPPTARDLLDEAFVAAQRASQTDTELSVTRMAARLSARDPALQNVIRERQDLESSIVRLEKELVETYAAPDQQERASQIRAQVSAASRKLQEIEQWIGKEFTHYQALVHPTPLKPTDVQSNLDSQEALVVFLLTFDHAFVWAITREQVAWHRLALDPPAIEARVSELRVSLEFASPAAALLQGKLFNLKRAHDLYRHLLGPVEHVLAGREQVVVVANGALTSLPFHALVTAPSRMVQDTPATYAGAPWLIRRHGISVLPSVGNLKSLRSIPAGALARRPLIGFGNPQFSREDRIAGLPASRDDSAGYRSNGTRSFASYWRGTTPDIQKLRELARLPNTELELKGIAQLLGVGDAPIYLGRAATELAVKSARLTDHRIVYFATHALVAGEMSSLAEPALALAVPDNPTPTDDGLLTASEVAQLKLDADWVVLSACNTAAGNRQGAEALSGLAQAFFYAGSRALLVSHWAVDDHAAAALMVQTFDSLAQSPALGRVDALRSAMLSRMADASRPWSGYPSYWAPFFVVGLNR